MLGNTKSALLGYLRVFELFQRTVREKWLALYDFIVYVRSDMVWAVCPDLAGLNRSLIWVANMHSDLGRGICKVELDNIPGVVSVPEGMCS